MKYEFTNETIMHNGRKLFRIRALKSFNGVEVGELGGFIEKEENLKHSGDAWVCGDARVSKTEDYLTIGPMGSRSGFTTFYVDRTNKIFVACGCFLNSIDNFEETVTTIHAGTKHEETYKLAIQLAKAQIVLK